MNNLFSKYQNKKLTVKSNFSSLNKHKVDRNSRILLKCLIKLYNLCKTNRLDGHNKPKMRIKCGETLMLILAKINKRINKILDLSHLSLMDNTNKIIHNLSRNKITFGM